MERSKIDPFQIRSLCIHNGQANMAVDQGPAMAWDMLDYRKDTSGKKSFAPSPPEHGGMLCRIAHSAITNHLMSPRLWHIEDRSAIDGDA
jgi:hypothetical protein